MTRPSPAALRTALVLGTAAGTLVLAPAASAAPLAAPSVSKSTVTWNEYFTVSGSGCIDPGTGAPGDVGVYGYEFGDGVHASPDGTWSLTSAYYGVPSGRYTLSATCMLPGGQQSYPAFVVTVNAPGQPPVPAPAPAPAPAPVPARPPAGSTSRATSSAPVPTTPAPPPPATPSATPAPAPTSSAAAAVPPTPAATCEDCARLAGPEPLEPGERLRLSYTGFQPGETVTVIMRSTPVTLGTFTADATGTLSADLDVPEDAETGSHTFTFSGAVTGDRVIGFELAAAERAAAATEPPAADDTSATRWLVVLASAFGVLLAGGMALAVRRVYREREGSVVATPPSGDQETVVPIAEPMT